MRLVTYIDLDCKPPIISSRKLKKSLLYNFQVNFKNTFIYTHIYSVN